MYLPVWAVLPPPLGYRWQGRLPLVSYSILAFRRMADGALFLPLAMIRSSSVAQRGATASSSQAAHSPKGRANAYHKAPTLSTPTNSITQRLPY